MAAHATPTKKGESDGANANNDTHAFPDHPLSAVLLEVPVDHLEEVGELVAEHVVSLDLLVLLAAVGRGGGHGRGGVGGEDDADHAGEAVDDLVYDGVGARLLQVVLARQAGLLGAEAGDRHGLPDLLAVPRQHGEGVERGACNDENRI